MIVLDERSLLASGRDALQAGSGFGAFFFSFFSFFSLSSLLFDLIGVMDESTIVKEKEAEICKIADSWAFSTRPKPR